MEQIYGIKWDWKYSHSKKNAPPVLNALFKMKSFAHFTPSQTDKRTLLDRKADLVEWWTGNRLGLIYPLLTAFGVSKDRKNKQQVLEEQKIVRILMREGNIKPEDDIHNGEGIDTESFFKFFVRLNNPHMALAIMPLKKLNLPQKEIDSIYYHIGNNLNKEESFSESKRLNETLVYELFKKDMIPSNKELFSQMANIVHQQDDTFFEKKKKQMLNQLSRAKTPAQIYSTFLINRKEKS